MNFLQAPITLIFVFDGSGRPGIKRGHRVVDIPPYWLEAAMELIDILGWQTHQAPGEAEAELAMMIRLGLIHGMITADSDSFVYGALYVLLPSNQRIEADEYMLYDLAEVLSHAVDGMGLTRGSLVLIALLCGGDYDPSGVLSCGPAVAHALARCGFGDELLRIIESGQSQARIDNLLADWRRRMRAELESNNSGYLGSRHPAIAQAIGTNFPNPGILRLITSPLTSWSSDHNIPVFRTLALPPNIFRLTQFCLRYFYWSLDLLFRRFEGYVWEGIFLQLLYSSLTVFDRQSWRFVGPDRSARVESSTLE
ncbi:PIN domain-like protein, partial [Crepidotus variabilis]